MIEELIKKDFSLIYNGIKNEKNIWWSITNFIQIVLFDYWFGIVIGKRSGIKRIIKGSLL